VNPTEKGVRPPETSDWWSRYFPKVIGQSPAHPCMASASISFQQLRCNLKAQAAPGQKQGIQWSLWCLSNAEKDLPGSGLTLAKHCISRSRMFIRYIFNHALGNTPFTTALGRVGALSRFIASFLNYMTFNVTSSIHPPVSFELHVQHL